MGAGHDVDAELARMKTELSQGSAPRQLESTPEPAQGAADLPAAQGARPADQPSAGDGQ